MADYRKTDQARVTCRRCGYAWVKDCTLGYEAEKDFFQNYRPECPKCRNTEWSIEEIIEVRLPLNENERELFSLIPSSNDLEEGEDL